MQPTQCYSNVVYERLSLWYFVIAAQTKTVIKLRNLKGKNKFYFETLKKGTKNSSLATQF